ncbi:hypothetical protein FG379_000697 [Cryptosporidium bovis]|uniref:uncharacterized protein n=1 Tax=Cryptosporidium bovis TaxID=310047 RepID=UPI00351A3D72|nr:hypothetical protein FG379_000697 [Cryptosporidium bovis]
MSSELVDWAQCELCKKWRKLPPGLNPSTLPDEWVCSMNTWDPFFNSCSALEEIVLNPAEGVNFNADNTVKQNLDAQGRAVKSRKKNVNSSSTNNLANLQDHCLKVHNSVLNDDNSKQTYSNFSLFNFLSKDIFNELKDWGDGIRHLKPSKEGRFQFLNGENDSLPSCWPQKYRDISEVYLFRNKTFEQFEKSKVKINQNWAKVQDSASTLGIFQSYPICMIRVKTPNLRNHPLFGRTIISGSEVSVAYEKVCCSSVKILPAFTNSQMIKNPNIGNSNLSHTNNISNAQKNQNLAPFISNSVSIEFIPAVKSDWNLPYLDLSNSLFTEIHTYSGSNQLDSWNSCSLSYNKLYSFEYISEETPLYISRHFRESNYKNTGNELNTTDGFNNVDILDLLPLLSWIEDNSKGMNNLYPKPIQCNLLGAQANRDSRKQNATKNIAKSKAKNLETDSIHGQVKVRRSSRTAQRAQVGEQISSFETKNILGSEKKDNVLQETFDNINTNIVIGSSYSLEISGNVNEDNKKSDKIRVTEEKDLGLTFNAYIEGDSRNLQLESDQNDLEENSNENEAKFDIITSNCSDFIDSSTEINKVFSSKENTNATFESVDVIEKVDVKSDIDFNSENTSKVMVESGSTDTDKKTSNKDSNYSVSEDISVGDNKVFDEDDALLINSSTRRKLKKRSRTFDNSSTLLVPEKSTDDIYARVYEEQNNKSKKLTKEKDYENADEQSNSLTVHSISNIQVIPKKKATEGTDRTSAGSPRGDPWVPVSDNSNKWESGSTEEIFQNQYHKTKGVSWQVEQKRQKSLEQRRSYYCSGRGNYSQHKYYTSSNYETYERHQYTHRNNNSNNTKKHYFSSNVNAGVQNSSKNDDNYNYRSCYYSKQSDIGGISNNSANSTIRTNHRSRLGDY